MHEKKDAKSLEELASDDEGAADLRAVLGAEGDVAADRKQCAADAGCKQHGAQLIHRARTASDS